VEEAPAPFLSRQQNAEMVRASKAILKEAGYRGAGTCEFLVGQDGVISFLEVNARIQVEHPVTEEVTGIDLVREQFRIASGESIGYADPAPTRHSIEFRINGEDAGRNFMPAPGVVTNFRPPSGPGVRLDSGVESGDVVGGAFDSMLAKLIITGKDRPQALARARRALAEFVIEGMPTVLPFHRAVVADEAFAPKNPTGPFKVHTRWIETEFVNDIPVYAGVVAGAPAEAGERQSVVVEVGGKRLEVVLPGGLRLGGGNAVAKKKAPKRSRGAKAGAAASGDSLTSPMQGTIVKIAVEEGQVVEAGELVVVLEAMKMEQPINAHKAGTITGLTATVGLTVANGLVLAEIKD
jgi:acetyl-CoA/propionyl-CoA carboxylase biotin carboxyl carrier protein